MTPKLIVKNVAKTFYYSKKEIKVLDNVSFSVSKAEFITIIGKSGSGKTTLFNLLAGIEKQTAGEIIFDKKIENIGYMLQKPLLLPWKTALENIVLGFTLRGISKQQARKKSFQLLKRFNLQQFANHYPATLSGGMAQRISMLRTVSFNNSFLLLDEPFGSLDPLTRISMQFWLRKIVENFNSTTLFITHDISEAIFLSDRIIVLGKNPSRILKDIEVDISRPRKREVLQTKKAIEIEKKLEKLLLQL